MELDTAVWEKPDPLRGDFWNEPQPRAGPTIYELRTYQLTPGTIIKCENNWSQAIKYRQENQEAVGGFFWQTVGLYIVYHLWTYKDLQPQEETRNATWRKRGLDENVYYTVPLVQHMECPFEDLASLVLLLLLTPSPSPSLSEQPRQRGSQSCCLGLLSDLGGL